MQGINNGITRDINFSLIYIFMQKILFGKHCRRKVVCCNTSGNLPIHFLRPRTIDISRTQTRFHMSYRYLLIKCSKCSRSRSSGITMYQNNIRLHLVQNITHTEQNTGSNIIQILIMFHYIQIIIGRYMEQSQYLV